MLDFQWMFVAITKFSLVTFAVLGLGAIVLRFVEQPIERIRLVQVSLAVACAAALVGVSNFAPVINLALLPNLDISSASGLRPKINKLNHQGNAGKASSAVEPPPYASSAMSDRQRPASESCEPKAQANQVADQDGERGSSAAVDNRDLREPF